ncbi:MAG: hypothetical protein QOE09_3011 [Ilumatobacteraceae bacterium]|jgi:hypothetical protein
MTPIGRSGAVESIEPRWLSLVVAMAASAGLIAFVASPRTALFWYIFPLFGLGGSYLVQFRSEFPPRWKVAWAASAVLSAVALAFDWPFSGHVLWNVLFIGHAWTTGKRRAAWMALMLGSLLYLFAMKIAFQTSRDVAGAVISVAVAAVVLLALCYRGTLRVA